MATWSKIKFYWDTMLGRANSTLTASSTDTTSDFDVDYLHNWLEVGRWKSGVTTTPIYITYDGGVGVSYKADYLTILGHNLFTSGASIGLEASSTGDFAGEEVTVLGTTAVTSDKVFHKEFTLTGLYRYWRLAITGTLTEAPYMTICVWGEKTELDYASSTFDPHGKTIKSSSSLSYAGVVTGVHEQYSERNIGLKFSSADSALYEKIKNWNDNVGLRNFFMSWDSANYPDEVFLVMSSENFSNPFNETGLYRDITINLKGRQE